MYNNTYTTKVKVDDCRGEIVSKQIQESFNMTVILQRAMIDPKLLKLNKPYNRKIEPMRLKKIGDSIVQHGYWPNEIIIITEDYGIVEGQHRTKKAIDLGITKLPCMIVRFASYEDEAGYFWYINSFNKKLGQLEYWNAKKESGNIIATTIYQLANDCESLFYNDISLKGRTNKITNYSIDSVLTIINYIALKKYQTYAQAKEGSFVKHYHCSTYSIIKKETNNFLAWFKSIFAPRSINNIPYRRPSLRVICKFFIILQTNNFNLNDSITKLQKLSVDYNFDTLSEAGKMMYIVNHYNKGKQSKNKIVGVDMF